MKIMVVGDTHGDYSWILDVLFEAQRYGVDAIVQVGDFGYWPHMPNAKHGTFHEYVNAKAANANIPFYWIDGNHENHTALRAVEWPQTNDGHWQQGTHLFYIPRGCAWTWDGVRLMGVGGAVSIDKAWRVKEQNDQFIKAHERWKQKVLLGSSMAEPKPEQFSLWWPEEAISDEEVERAVSNGKVDVLFTHDAPASAEFKNRLKPDVDSQIHRHRMSIIGASAKPKLWVHGHYHDALEYDFRHAEGYSRVYGLECNSRAMSHRPTRQFLVVDLDNVRQGSV